MSSMVAFIAGQHGLARENLATELLVHILEISSIEVVREFLGSHGVSGQWQPHGYRFEPQRGMTGDRSIPDVKVIDSDEKLCAIIENKFSARLTQHQPVDYLKALPVCGVLLFIVPEGRRCVLFKELLEKCHASETFEDIAVQKPDRTALVDGRFMEIASWEDALERLAELHRTNVQQATESSERLADIEQLRRFCEVVDKETFDPLTAEQIRGTGISTVIHQLTWITSQLIARCIERGIVQQRSDSPKRGSSGALRAEADSSLYFGQELRFCDADIWIGFWGAAWEERKLTPLWIEISAREPRGDAIVRQVQKAKGAEAVVRRAKGGWLIPIPMSPDRDQEEAVEEAVRFVSDLKSAGK
jgi:hypothetical protein